MADIHTIIKSIPDVVKIIGDLNGVSITKPLNLNDADEHSISWIKGTPDNADSIIRSTKAKVLVCSDQLGIREGSDKVFILCSDPKNTYINIIKKLFVKKREASIHPSAIIDKEAKIGMNVFIGPNVVIQKCVIGDNCTIHGNVFLFDNTHLGNNVTINPGTAVGTDGFGYSRNADNTLEKFPHFGGVIIHDNVEIGSNTCIDRGTLGNTVIHKGVKIDNLVHVAHNVVIGENCLIIANAMIGGSTIIGANSHIAPSVSLMNKLVIGDNVTVGLGAVVTKNIPSNETWVGNPAKPLHEFIDRQKKIKEL